LPFKAIRTAGTAFRSSGTDDHWSEYDAALRRRGSLPVWSSDEAIAAWRAAPRTTRGGPPRTVSWLTMTPRAASTSSTMRMPSGKRKYNQIAWLMTSAGKRCPA
jgi:hypothetical protein